MKAPRVFAQINAIATLHGIPTINFHVGFEAALAVHGVAPGYDDIEVFVDSDTYGQLGRWYKSIADRTGVWLALPGGISVSSLGTLETAHTWETRNGVKIATLESLYCAYQHLADQLEDPHSKQQRYVDALETALQFAASQRHKGRNEELYRLAPSTMALTRLGVLVDLAKETGESQLAVEYKDNDHLRWRLTLDHNELTIRPANGTSEVVHIFSIKALENIVIKSQEV